MRHNNQGGFNPTYGGPYGGAEPPQGGYGEPHNDPGSFQVKKTERMMKKGCWPKSWSIIKIHNFDPIIMKLCQNDELMSS